MIKIGNKYSNWTVLREALKRGKKPYFYCRCNCGSEKEISAYELAKENSRSCRKCRHIAKAIQSNQKFGKWTVLRSIESEEKRKHYEVQCDCGFIRILKGIRLRFGDSTGCRKCRSKKHGMVHSKTYSTWESMIQRCTNPNNTNYKHYGERGISVCDRWLKFENFFEDMKERPRGLELDRINNDGNYEPNNCHWTYHRDNLMNRRNSKK